MDEPFTNEEAQRRARRILENGRVRFSRHARERMVERSLGEQDAVNVIGRGWCEFYTPKGAQFTYTFHTKRLGVAVAFKGDDVLVVVTLFRL